jgi:hypothetical protein
MLSLVLSSNFPCVQFMNRHWLSDVVIVLRAFMMDKITYNHSFAFALWLYVLLGVGVYCLNQIFHRDICSFYSFFPNGYCYLARIRIVSPKHSRFFSLVQFVPFFPVSLIHNLCNVHL